MRYHSNDGSRCFYCCKVLADVGSDRWYNMIFVWLKPMCSPSHVCMGRVEFVWGVSGVLGL